MNKTIKLTIRELIPLTTFKNVSRALKYHYPVDHNNYEKLFYRLGKMQKFKVKPDEFLEIYGGIPPYYLEDNNLDKFIKDIKDEMNDTGYGINILKPKDKLIHWSMSFVPWKKLANMPISHDTLCHYSFEDIIAHFIWEITFYGNEKQMNKQKNIIFERMREAKKQIKKDKLLK